MPDPKQQAQEKLREAVAAMTGVVYPGESTEAAELDRILGYSELLEQEQELRLSLHDERENVKRRNQLLVDMAQQRQELLEALKAVLELIEQGKLVRDVTRDNDPNWALHQIGFVRILGEAQALISKAEEVNR